MAKNSITIELDGMEELKKRFASLGKEGRKRVNRAINVNAIEFHREVKNSITRNTGRYRRYRRGGKWHYSSMPGSPPNSDTGNLRKNIRVTSKATNARNYAEIISGAKYSAALEKAKAPRKKRPFMSPMVRKKNKVFVSRIKQAIRGIL